MTASWTIGSEDDGRVQHRDCVPGEHAWIAVTTEIYTAADGTSRRDAIGKLSKLLGATSG